MVINVKKTFYILPQKMSEEEAYEAFENELMINKKYKSNYNKSSLKLEVMYRAYYFFDSRIDSLPYFYINEETGEKYNGKIDVSCILNDSEFIVNELNKKDFIIYEGNELCVHNKKSYDAAYRNLIKKLKDKAYTSIVNNHNLKRNMKVHIDVAPFEEINTCRLDIYYERIYIFKYKQQSIRKEYVCILSDYYQCFYQFEFDKSEEYINYLKKYKIPLESIPKQYLDVYYTISYNSYLSVIKKLQFESSRGLYKKIKSNIDYEEYSLYIDYLYSGIFYFKNKKFLSRINTKVDSLKERILLSFLTLSFQSGSGMFLYECAKLYLLEDSSVKKQIYFLKKSYKLGSLEAKKLLYDHYNEPMYYDEVAINKYK